MRHHILAGCAAVLLSAGSSLGAELVNKPIDTQNLVVKPSQTAADLASRTIKIVGSTTASVIERDGFVKTFNNIFRSPTPKTKQPNGLPLPNQFPSTSYKSYNTPQMPILVPTRR